MNKIFLLFEQFSFWELAVYALMYGVLLAFLVAGVNTLVKFVKEIITDSKFANHGIYNYTSFYRWE